MSAKLFIASIFLIFLWAIGFLVYHIGGAFHILLAIGFIGLIIRLLYNNSIMK